MSPLAKNFPIVCVGGSAGGSASYVQLLRHLPPEMGVAIVIVNHLRKTAATLHKILPHHTTMPVDVIMESLSVQPNHVFIIPSNHDLCLLDGEFRIKPISKPKGWPDVITRFLHSLAQNWDGKLAGPPTRRGPATASPRAASSRQCSKVAVEPWRSPPASAAAGPPSRWGLRRDHRRRSGRRRHRRRRSDDPDRA